MSSGEEKAWEILSGLNPLSVCRNASASFDEKQGSYTLRSFCTDFLIHPAGRTVRGTSPQGEIILKKYGYFFIHSCLRYLIHAKDIPLTERLVKPADIQGGEMFFQGSHVLPLDKLSGRYGGDREAFFSKGKELCAEILHYGDASLHLLPMPRIPVVLILWLEDEEFPARTDLLFDSSCGIHLPLDIIWSTAMLSVLVMV
jgi:hypothetical protein